jgi:hypothetical protein
METDFRELGLEVGDWVYIGVAHPWWKRLWRWFTYAKEREIADRGYARVRAIGRTFIDFERPGPLPKPPEEVEE